MSYSNPNNGPTNQGDPNQHYGQSYQNKSNEDYGYEQYNQTKTAAAGAGDVAGGQNISNQKNNSEWLTMPTNAQLGGYQYADPASFADNNAANIYGVINNQLNNRANQAAPLAQNTPLGLASSLGPLATSQAAQLSPTQMYSGANLNTAQDNQYAAAQAQQINALNATAQGQGPSVAAVQARQLAAQNAATTAAQLGSQRGASNPALAQRAAAQALASGNQSAAATGALGKAQEAIAAQNAVTGALSGARGQTQATSTTAAQLQQAAGLANQQAALTGSTTNAQLLQQNQLAASNAYNAAAQQQAALQQQRTLQAGSQDQQTNLANLTAQGQQNQLNAQVYGQGLTAYQQQNQTDISNQASLQQLLASQENTLAGLNVNQAINSQNNSMGLAGAGIQGGAALLGGLAMMSDRNTKQNIKRANSPMMNFLAIMGA